jgi:hypothetical protein
MASARPGLGYVQMSLQCFVLMENKELLKKNDGPHLKDTKARLK